MKMFNEKAQATNRSDINSVERPQTQCQETGKPIQKLIKSGSQVLGKQRSRPNLTRKEILKQMTDKNNNIQTFVNAANANALRCMSNEKSMSNNKHNDMIGSAQGGMQINTNVVINNQMFNNSTSVNNNNFDEN